MGREMFTNNSRAWPVLRIEVAEATVQESVGYLILMEGIPLLVVYQKIPSGQMQKKYGPKDSYVSI